MSRLLAALLIWLSLGSAAWAQVQGMGNGIGTPTPVNPQGLGYAIGQGSIAIVSGGTGYAAGDTITLQCSRVTFSTAPVITVNTVSAGVIVGSTLTNTGTTSAIGNNGTCTLTQASTSGVGSGATWTGVLGTIAGNVSLASLSTGGGVTNGNTFLGAETPNASGISGSENTFFGDRAGGGFIGAVTAASAFGHDACGIFGASTPTGSYNSCFGNDAGRNIAGSAQANTLLGQNSGRTVSGSFNTIVGAGAGISGTTGQNNTLVGYNTGPTNLGTGSGNVLIGINCDTASANANNQFAVCGGGGKVWSMINGSTPSTSATTIAGTLTISGITADTAQTDATVCEDTTNHKLFSGSGTLGVCLGTSSLRYKRDWHLTPDGLTQVMALKPGNYFYKPGHGDNGARQQYGFLAEDVVHVLPKLTGLDAQGKPNSVDILGMVPVMVKAIQQQQAEIAELRQEVRLLKHHR